MPRRFVRGRHFEGTPAELQVSAKAAADRLGKISRTVIDKMSPERVIWVQFADAELDPGAPCPCGGRRLRRLNGTFARCESCDALLILRSEALEPAEGSGRTAKMDRSDRTQLSAYVEVQLVQYDSLPDRRRFCGHGYLPNGRHVLLLVDFPADADDDISDPLRAIDRPHTVSSFPIEPFGDAIQIERLPG
jgi:hypothetical protein